MEIKIFAVFIVCTVILVAVFYIRKSYYNNFLQSRIDREYIYGICNNVKARKHKRNGNVQFVLWKVGEMDNKEPIWHDFDSSHWHKFIQTK